MAYPKRDVSEAQKAIKYGPLPRWNYGKSHSLTASNASVSGAASHAPYSQPFTVGYDIKAARITNPDRLAAVQQTYNGMISDGQFQLPVFVMNVGIDIAQSGTTAQSRWTRDFYPHNFTQPDFTINGQSLNQGDYGELCEFIHQAQQKAVFSGYSHLTQISIGRGSHPIGGYPNRPDSTLGVTVSNSASHNGSLPNQSIKGLHSPIIAKGYITTINRRHQRGVVAPEWSFGFVVTYMIKGPYQDTVNYSVVQGNDWITMLRTTQAQPGTISSNTNMIQANTSALAKAKSSQVNIFTDRGSS